MGDLLAALIEWTSTSYRSLQQQGWTVTLEDFEDGERVVLELENEVFLGRFVLQDTGQIELGVRDKRTAVPRRGKGEVYTAQQLEDAVRQFVEWLEQDHGSIHKSDQTACPHGKMVYESRGEAHKVLQRITAQRHGNNGLEVYQCRMCQEWHIGGKLGRIGIKRRSFPQHRIPRKKRKDT